MKHCLLYQMAAGNYLAQHTRGYALGIEFVAHTPKEMIIFDICLAHCLKHWASSKICVPHDNSLHNQLPYFFVCTYDFSLLNRRLFDAFMEALYSSGYFLWIQITVALGYVMCTAGLSSWLCWRDDRLAARSR